MSDSVHKHNPIHQHKHGVHCDHHHSHALHSHAHHHSIEGVTRGKLIISIFLNFLITIVQVIGGLMSGSLALLSDALHNFSDAIALIISYIAIKLSLLASNEQRTFGYKRAEILAAMFNSVILIAASVALFHSAINRFFHPVAVNSQLMIVIALVGLAANAYSAILLRKEAKDNINIRSAYLHLFTDALSSLSVAIGGVLILYFKLFWIDPCLTILIGLYVLLEGYEIFKTSVNILMQAVPAKLDVRLLQREIERLPKVKNIHHVHVWQLTEGQIHFQAHINLKSDVRISETIELTRRIEKLLEADFSIKNSIFQFEIDSCENPAFIKGMKE